MKDIVFIETTGIWLRLRFWATTLRITAQLNKRKLFRNVQLHIHLKNEMYSLHVRGGKKLKVQLPRHNLIMHMIFAPGPRYRRLMKYKQPMPATFLKKKNFTPCTPLRLSPKASEKPVCRPKSCFIILCRFATLG